MKMSPNFIREENGERVYQLNLMVNGARRLHEEPFNHKDKLAPPPSPPLRSSAGGGELPEWPEDAKKAEAEPHPSDIRNASQRMFRQQTGPVPLGARSTFDAPQPPKPNTNKRGDSSPRRNEIFGR